MFQNVHSALGQGGRFCFDIQAIKHIENWIHEYEWEDQGYRLINTGEKLGDNQVVVEIKIEKESEKYVLSFIGSLWRIEEIVEKLNLS